MPRAPEPDIGDIYRESEKVCEEYEACLTTTIYGDTYLDPEKCKARGFDPKKASEEEDERLRLGIEWIERTTKEKGFRAQFEEFLDKVPSKYVSKDPKSLAHFDYLDDLPKKRNKRNKNVNKNSKSLACFDDLDDLPKERNKRNKKLTKTKIRSLMIKASYLVGRKVEHDDGLGVKFVKVISAKMNEDGVFLEVEEKVGAELEYYEIMYQEDIVVV
ncbi:hypothetical protein C1645_745348 [Glomus cerebriforme]|uniref:Uncharacterized protein n=1 Tax=Glomus cerebriforme TaxID=658196 RepID=A0A397S6C1_9GLOM|nr:hypothetical protein C1645_745348 [Glomus cerebriforme]